MIDDETVQAYRSALALRDLYDAYRATSRAHALVLDRVERTAAADPRITEERRVRTRREVARRRALAVETDAVFATRADQLQRRLRELRDLPVGP